MADDNICSNCGISFPTIRGLNIHIARIHPQGDNPTRSGDEFESAKQKFEKVISKSRPSVFANMLLAGPAERYHDPNIRLSPSQCSDLDATLQELTAEMGGGYAKEIAPYLPWVALFMVVIPIAFEKWELISAHRSGPTPPPPVPRDEPPPKVAAPVPESLPESLPELNEADIPEGAR